MNPHAELLGQVLEKNLGPGQLQQLSQEQEAQRSQAPGQGAADDSDTIATPEWDAADETPLPSPRLRGRLRRARRMRPLPQGGGNPVLAHERQLSSAERDAAEARAKQEAQKSILPHVRKGMHHCSTCGKGYFTTAKAVACHGSGEYRARGKRKLSHASAAGKHDLEDPAARAALAAGLSEGTRLAARVRRQVLRTLKKK